MGYTFEQIEHLLDEKQRLQKENDGLKKLIQKALIEWVNGGVTVKTIEKLQEAILEESKS